MALSVWARKPPEVVLVVYTFWAIVLLLWPIWYGLTLREARRPTGPLEYSWPTRTIWQSHPIPPPVSSISGTISVSSRRRWGQPRAGGAGRLADAARRAAGRTKAARDRDRLGRPPVARTARPVARRQSRALARVASIAAIALDDDPGCAGGRLDRRRLCRRRCRRLDQRAGRLGRSTCLWGRPWESAAASFS